MNTTPLEQAKELEMSSSVNRRFFALAAAVMITTLAMVVGCSDNPVAPQNQTSEPRLLTRATSSSSVALAPVNLYAEKVISSAEGGTLSLLDVTLTVPVGAVPNDTLFSIRIPDDEIFYNEFGTDGLVFGVPVTVTMSYRDADLSGIHETAIRIAWLDEDSNTWKDMPCVVDTVTKTVTGTLNHFSAYGLISD
jgi:hypothetical protein